MFSLRFRQQIARPQASLELCLLGIAGGVIAASLIVLFRLALSQFQLWILSGEKDYQGLTPWVRAALPIAATLVIIGVARLTHFKHQRMGIPFVIYRLRSFYGYIPLKNTLNQFVGSVLAIASGFNVGREGPAVHIGAAGSSFIGQWLKLPFNSIRILSGCGMAAGIAASFNTPLAAVILVMEVVMREYKVHIFVPVMLSAVCGSVMTTLVFGESIELHFLDFAAFEYSMYPYFILFGVLLGLLSKVFNQTLIVIMQKFKGLVMTQRLLLAAIITSAIGLLLPQSIGSELTHIATLVGETHSETILISILCAKLLLTWFALGLGIPGGIIGPIFGIGMLAGAVFAEPLTGWIATSDCPTTSFALLGMAGLLSATIHAPLSALTAVMELSYQPQVILPAMMVIVSAYITSIQFCKNKSTFKLQLQAQNLDTTQSSVSHALQKTGVLGVVNKDCQLVTDQSNEQLRNTLIADDHQHYLVNARFYAIDATYTLAAKLPSTHEIQIYSIQGVSSQSTLAEVYELLSVRRTGAVYVFDEATHQFIGIVTWLQIQDILHKEYF